MICYTSLDTETAEEGVAITPDQFEKKKHLKLQLEVGKEKFKVDATKVLLPPNLPRERLHF